MKVSPVMAAHLRRCRSRSALTLPASFALRPFSGRVISIPDGDGLVIYSGDHPVNIRLWGCDAPEWGQPNARWAWKHLIGMVWTEPVTVFPVDRDRYGRIVADCYGFTKMSLSFLMILSGWAWYTPRYAPQQTLFADAQRYAQFYRKGLWKQSNPVPPWIFRGAQRAGRKAKNA